MRDDVTLADVDAEYARRIPWWRFAPPDDRAAYLEAEAMQDRKTLRRLRRRGNRRLEIEGPGGLLPGQVCVHGGFYMEFRGAERWADPSHYGDEWPDAYRPGCRCLERVLASDALWKLAAETTQTGVVRRRTRVKKFAERLHADLDLTTAGLIREVRAEQARRAARELARQSAPLHAELERHRLADELAEAATEESPAATPPAARPGHPTFRPKPQVVRRRRLDHRAPILREEEAMPPRPGPPTPIKPPEPSHRPA